MEEQTNTTTEPTPEEIAAEREAEREHHRSHQVWLERRVQLFAELATILAAHTKGAEDDHDVSLAQTNKARVLSALDDLLLPPKDERSPLARFFDNLAESPVLPDLIEQLAKIGTGKPLETFVETPEPAEVVAPADLSDEELSVDEAEARRWYKEILDERARRERPAGDTFAERIASAPDEHLAGMAAAIAAERERRAAPPPAP